MSISDKSGYADSSAPCSYDARVISLPPCRIRGLGVRQHRHRHQLPAAEQRPRFKVISHFFVAANTALRWMKRSPRASTHF
jgi:hypothetical protein